MFHMLSWNFNVSEFCKIKSSRGLRVADRTKVNPINIGRAMHQEKAGEENGFASVKLRFTINLDVELSPQSFSQGARMS